MPFTITTSVGGAGAAAGSPLSPNSSVVAARASQQRKSSVKGKGGGRGSSNNPPAAPRRADGLPVTPLNINLNGAAHAGALSSDAFDELGAPHVTFARSRADAFVYAPCEATVASGATMKPGQHTSSMYDMLARRPRFRGALSRTH